MAFGERLRFFREEAGLSQGDIARRLDVDRSTITQWEASKRQPNLQMAKRLAAVLGVTLDLLVEDPDKKQVSIASLRVFLRAGRKLKPEDAASLLAFAQYVAQAKPGELKVPLDPIHRAR